MPPRSNIQLASDNLRRVYNHFLPAFTAAPTATTTPEIPSQFVLAKRAIAEHDSAIHAFHASVVQETSLGRSRLLSSIHDRFRHISPCYRIPVEIWVRIFKIVTSEDPEHDSLLPTNPRNVLCRVCRGWRHVVESLPEMWTEIWLDESLAVPESAQTRISEFLVMREGLLNEILRFSVDLPLIIMIYAQSSSGSLTEALAYPVILSLVQHSHRWAQLEIVEGHPHAMIHALAASRQTFGISVLPSLHHLHLELPGSASKDAPGLVDLSFFEISLPNLDSIYIELHGLDYRRIIPDLKSCTSITIHRLEHADFSSSYDFFGEARDYYAEEKEFTLPNLKTLSVRVWDYEFFAFMTAPELANIYVETIYNRSDGEDVRDFIAKSHCMVTSFTFGLIFREGNSPSVIQDLISSLPNLRYLVLCEVHCELSYMERYCRKPDRAKERQATIAAFLAPLAQTANGQLSSCESLQYLHIFPTHPPSPHFSPVLMTQLVDVMELRWRFAVPGVSGLSEVTGIPELRDGESFSEQHLAQYERLKALEGEGLKVGYAK